ncbi:MAG: multidrug ABC transporter ATP-binding protein, partial [Burkholderiales bacterium]
QLALQLQSPLERIPPLLARYKLELAADGCEMIYTYDAQADRAGIAALLRDLAGSGIAFKDLHTTQSSLEDIFVDLVSDRQ